MIPQSRFIAVLALIGALALHGLGLPLSATPEAAQIEGGATAEAALGSTFANLVTGVKTPVQAPEQTQPVTPQTATPTSPTRPVSAQAVTPPAQTALAPLPPATQKPAPQKPKQPAAKPKAEPQKKPAPKKPKVEPEKRQTAAPKPKGNSAKTAAQGTVTGSKTAKGASSGKGQTASAKSGNAATGNYKGAVLRKIARSKRGRTNIRGSAYVRLQIAPNGRLASASIIKSSGSPQLDKVALAQVRRASPFPRPPGGQKIRLTVEVTGK